MLTLLIACDVPAPPPVPPVIVQPQVEVSVDLDGDGHGADDCDDDDPDRFPGANEVAYDGVDQDCDGSDLVDVDQDGFPKGPDCDDRDPRLHPGAIDPPYDGVDWDCDGLDPVDVDLDGVPGQEVGGPDCNDHHADVYPAAPDPGADGADTNCDGVDGVDRDQDGFASEATQGPDCDDGNAAVHPLATDLAYDGLDQDCDGGCDFDGDGDGDPLIGAEDEPGCEGRPLDCDDEDPLVRSGDLTTDSVPEPGETWFESEDAVWFALRVEDPAVSLVLRDAQGVEVAGEVLVDGVMVRFVPAAPLPPASSFDVRIEHPCGVEEWSFTTAPGFDPVDPTTLVGSTWPVDLAAGEWAGDPDISWLVAGFFGEGMLLEVVGAGATTLDLRVAGAASAGDQDVCVQTTELVGVDFAGDPWFTFQADLYTPVNGDPVPLYGATVTGGVRGDRLSNLELSGSADLRALNVTWACGGLVTCEPCPDGVEACLAVAFADLDGAPVEVDLVERTAEDVAADAACP